MLPICVMRRIAEEHTKTCVASGLILPDRRAEAWLQSSAIKNRHPGEERNDAKRHIQDVKETFCLSCRSLRGISLARRLSSLFSPYSAGLIGIGAAHAQAPSAPHYVVAYIEVASQSQEQAAALLKSWAKTVRKNPDNLGIAPLRRIGPTNHFAIVEFWKNAKAFENQSGVA